MATREALAQCLTEMEAFEPKGRAKKSGEAFDKILKKPAKKFPALKGVVEVRQALFDDLNRGGPQYKGYEEAVTHQFLLFKDRTVYLLQYQLRVLDMCIERAEFNEQVGEKK